MRKRGLAEQALAGLDFTEVDGEVVEASRAKVVHSARIPPHYSEQLEAEATRLGTNPSALICEYVIEALNRARQDEVVTLRRSDLQRAIEKVIKAA
jgi:hypothetical protein